MTVHELAEHLSCFANNAYDTSDWTESFTREVSEKASEIVSIFVAAKAGQLVFYEMNLILNLYLAFGVTPRKFNVLDQWYWWLIACNSGSDELAFRLLMDGFNPKVRMHGFHSARHYAKANRLNLPKTWSYFCQEDLTKKAAKVRKRSWANGTYTERAM